MSTISAIITSTRPHMLDRAIHSVLAQTRKPDELIILKDPGKIGAIRNEGVRQAKGEFIAFLDDDDEWFPEKLTAQIQAIQDCGEGTALVYGGFRKGAEDVHWPAFGGKILTDLLWARDDFTGSASNALIRKSAINAVGGFNEHLETSEDWELYLRLADRFLIEGIGEVVCQIQKHSEPRLGDKVSQARAVELLVLQRYWTRMSWPLRSLYLGKLLMHSSPDVTRWYRTFKGALHGV